MLIQAPSADAAQYHFEKKDALTLEQGLDSLLCDNISDFRRCRLFGLLRDAAVDFRPVSYYGKPAPWSTAS